VQVLIRSTGYRTRRANYEAEQTLPESDKTILRQPVLFIQALGDSILKPEMSKNMEKTIPNLTRGEVPSSHWALWHTPQQTNELIKNWIEGVVLGGKSKL
jgi:soluble epoxide hydrolase / lipid-phosphate phosphatase